LNILYGGIFVLVLRRTEEVLEIIAQHSDGIKMVDIGNELGVDWRTLINDIIFLVDNEQIDKIGNLYYPISTKKHLNDNATSE
jgi:predicted transcriptional regulator